MRYKHTSANPRLHFYQKLFVSQTSRIRSISWKMSAIIHYIKNIPLSIDYDGQARAEKLSRIIITLFGVVGLIWGYLIQQFSQTLYILGAGFFMAAIITLPPWPMYRRKPLNWQKPRAEAPVSQSQNKKK